MYLFAKERLNIKKKKKTSFIEKKYLLYGFADRLKIMKFHKI